MDLRPLISVVVPCYNMGNFLEDCINSVLAQTYTNWECLIVDDGSTDNSSEIALQLTTLDDRIKYLKKENGGLSSARNFGIQHANGSFILPLDADDIIGKDYLEEAVQAFNQNPELKLVYCEAEFFGEKTGRWDLREFNLKDLARTNMIFCTALFKKEDWVRVNGYDENMKSGWEDWDFWISILKNGGEVKRLPLVGFFYRIRPASMLRSMTEEEVDYLCDYVYQKHLEFMKTQLGNPIKISNEVHHYVAELQKSQIELEKKTIQLQETMVALQQTQATLEQATKELQETQTQLHSTQTELHNTQTQLNNTQTQLNDTQTQLNNTQIMLQKIRSNRFVRLLKKIGVHID